MVKTAKLTAAYWDEVVRHVAYQQNHSMSEAIEKKIPCEALSGKLPNSSDIEIFGSTAFMYTHKQQRKWKFSDQASTEVHMGSKNGLYRVYIPYTKGGIETRHIPFDETIKDCNVEIELRINKSEIIAGNEVPTRKLTLTDDTDDKFVSRWDEAYTDKQTVQEPAEASVPRNELAQCNYGNDAVNENMTTTQRDEHKYAMRDRSPLTLITVYPLTTIPNEDEPTALQVFNGTDRGKRHRFTTTEIETL